MSDADLRAELRLRPGAVDLADYDPRSTPGFSDGKDAAKEAMKPLGDELDDLQERLWAAGTRGEQRRLLLVLQGMDTAGKGGVIRKAVGLLDPQGVQIASFKAPTPEELEQDFLWRVEKQLPQGGRVGIFDRSHYEDVLIARVRKLVDAGELERRYSAINDFEQRLVDDGVTVIKCFLHVSSAKQKERLRERLDNPAKYWKFNPGDVDERKLWDDYQEAYRIALQRCSTDVAPWYVVPADRKWYRNWAVARLLRNSLADLGLEWPEPDFDVEEQKRRLAAS